MMSNVCARVLKTVRVVTRNNYEFELVLEHHFCLKTTKHSSIRPKKVFFFTVFISKKISLMMFNYQEPTQAKHFFSENFAFHLFEIFNIDSGQTCRREWGMKVCEEEWRVEKNLSSLIFAHLLDFSQFYWSTTATLTRRHKSNIFVSTCWVFNGYRQQEKGEKAKRMKSSLEFEVTWAYN